MRNASTRLPDATLVELVQALFGTLPPTLIMTGLLLAVGLLAEARTDDPLLAGLIAIGGLCSALRIGVVLHGRGSAPYIIEREEAETLERRFAASYLPFALVLGLFAARLYALGDKDFETLAAVLVSGYAAGVAAGVYVRPWISVPSIALAVAPVTIVAALSPLDVDRLLGLVLAAFAAGGIGSVLAHYRSEVAKVSVRLKLATMSRQDELTSLPNRLALVEEYEAALRALDTSETLWVHFIDLEGFVAANQRFGQLAGDGIIRTAASRLSGVVGDNGLPARLGGARFCVLQTQTRHSSEAEVLAHRIVRALGEAYVIGETSIPLSADVAFVRTAPGLSLDTMLEKAASGLMEDKQDGGGRALRVNG